MLSRSDIIGRLRSAKPLLIEKYSVSSIALFGSYSRDEARTGSDIDLLVEFRKPVGLSFVHLADELELLLQHKVDLVSRKGVKSNYLDTIKQDLIYV